MEEKIDFRLGPTLEVSEKYRLYEKAVQSPDFEVEFFNEKYLEYYKKAPRVFREDFCGTGKISCEWVKLHPKNYAIGIDLDQDPIQYGQENHVAKLKPAQQKRIKYIKENVLKADRYKADIVAALNFSYFIFKKRKELLAYFKSVRKSLNPQGVFFIDLFGGSACSQPIVDEVKHKNFSYFWDLESFNPINNECLYKIHFKVQGKSRKYKDVFVYDWRMWSLPELMDLLEDAGFSKSFVYWEGDDDDGGGDGNFQVTKETENCDSWVSYIAAFP